MIIYHHENMHYEMILLITFVVIDDSHVDEDMMTGVKMDSTSDVHDDSGNPFLIVLSYKNCISCTRDHNIVTKTDCR